MKKKIVIASDSFKGSASSKEVGTYISKGFLSVSPEFETSIYAIADGGEGTVDAILEVNDGQKVTLTVQNPLGNPVEAYYAVIDNGKTAVMEMAAASGITLTEPSAETVLKASTYGTGELLKDALEKGVDHIYIGIGGSATNDGGMGMAAALGAKFYDEKGHQLIASAENLERIASIDTSDLDRKWESIDVQILSDVTNPLCGDNGATAVYGPQKGATPEIVARLDAGLNHYANIILKDLGKDIKMVPGAGAAGGRGAGLMAFLDGKSQKGIDKILEMIQIEEAIKSADLVVTGEGRMDGQSVNGKAPIGIATIAKKYGVPTVAIVGSRSLDLQEVYRNGISGVFDIVNAPMTLEAAMTNTAELITSASQNVATLVYLLIHKA